jgi:hypothetical protein
LEHWEWKYLDNPITERIITVAEKDSEIIGASHLTMCSISIGDEIFIAGNGADVATHPEHRRKGVYNRLRQLKKQDVIDKSVFWYGITSNPILIKKHDQKGSDVVFPSQKAVIYMRMQTVSASRSSWIKKMGYLILRSFNSITNRSPQQKNPFRIESTKRFDERVLSLMKESKKVYKYLMERDAKYLNWRYADPRGGNYHILSAYEGEKLLGFIVVRINKYEKSNPLGYVMDLMVEPSRLDVADSLMKEGLKLFLKEEVNVVYYLGVEGNHHTSVLRRNGFVNSRESLLWNYIDYPGVRDLSVIIRELSSGEIYFTFGDFDWM